MGNGDLRILRSGCAIAEFRGTDGDPEETLHQYALSRNTDYGQANAELGRTNAHAVVIMSGFPKYMAMFDSYITQRDLGRAWLSDSKPNINHQGWNGGGDSDVVCLMYQPDHDALTEWVRENYESDYELS